jgi:hypothetical protein
VNTAVEQKSNKAMSENPMALAQAMQQAMMDDRRMPEDHGKNGQDG